MNKKIDKKDHYLDSLNYICSNQLENGMILWDSSGKFDPWDHIEAAMALTVFDKFEDAYEFSKKHLDTDKAITHLKKIQTF